MVIVSGTKQFCDETRVMVCDDLREVIRMVICTTRLCLSLSNCAQAPVTVCDDPRFSYERYRCSLYFPPSNCDLILIMVYDDLR